MADQHGGYRRPAQPAPVSGPGKLSKRTDGFGKPNPEQAVKPATGLPYGENKQVTEIAQSAPLAAAANPLSAQVTPLSAPSSKPYEPVTAGQPSGPGPSRTDMPSQHPDDVVAGAIREAYRAAPSPQLRMLMNYLEEQGR